MDSDLEVDFNIVVSIPTTQNTGKGSKQVTLYLLVVEATSTCSGKIWQWKKVRRYSEFYGLYQRLKKNYPNELKAVTFPPKKVFGRLNTSVIRERRTLLENFLGTVVENIVIINSDTHLRSFLELDKTLAPIVMQEKNWSAQDLVVEPETSNDKFARALYNFEARSEDELSLIAGEYISVVNSNNGGWWEGQTHGEVGLFPRNYVELVDEVPEDYMDDLIAPREETPELPEPVIPTKLKEDVRTRRRTLLLKKLNSGIPELPAKSSVPSSVPYVAGTALFNFKGETEFELSFKKGDIVTVYTIDQITGWWQGKVGNAIGYFPGSYVVLPAGAEDILLALTEEETAIINEVTESIIKKNDDKNVNDEKEKITETLEEKKIEKQDKEIPNITIQQDNENITKPNEPKQNTGVKPNISRNSIRLQGNPKPARRPVPTRPQQNKIKLVTENSPNFARRCILCPCDKWKASEHEKNICLNCRHLGRMHRVQSQIIKPSN